jgi:hypothetical protein
VPTVEAKHVLVLSGYGGLVVAFLEGQQPVATEQRVHPGSWIAVFDSGHDAGNVRVTDAACMGTRA